MVIFFLQKRKYRFLCFLTIHFTCWTVQTVVCFQNVKKKKLRKRWRVLVSYLRVQRIRLNDKSPLCTMSMSFGDGTYDAKNARVNSGLLYAVFLLPNQKFSQLNVLASCITTTLIKLVLVREIRITSWHNNDVTILHLLVIMCFFQIHVILLVCCWLAAAMLVVKRTKAIFMLFLRKEFYCIDHQHGTNKLNKPTVKSTYYTKTPDGTFIFSKTLLFTFFDSETGKRRKQLPQCWDDKADQYRWSAAPDWGRLGRAFARL